MILEPNTVRFILHRLNEVLRPIGSPQPEVEDRLYGPWELCAECKEVLVPRTEEYEYATRASEMGSARSVLLLGYRCSACTP